MGFKFVLTNPEAMVGLPPGRYQSNLIEATWEQITVEYAGRPYDPDDPCLLPLTVHDDPQQPGGVPRVVRGNPQHHQQLTDNARRSTDMTTTNDRGEAIPTAPVFNRDDKVTVDGGPTVYTVVTLHSYGKDVLVRQNPNHSGTWVSIDQVAHVQVDQ